MSESRQTHVTLHDIDPRRWSSWCNSAYTAEIVVGEGNTLLPAASCFSSNGVRDACCKFLLSHDLSICPQVRLQHFVEVSKTEKLSEFFSLLIHPVVPVWPSWPGAVPVLAVCRMPSAGPDTSLHPFQAMAG
uniref:Uncharacterized protein n=1 Tax=Malurus cyaneus samueli TaxID=2593467 RepID=A0A8C5U8V9_9PASS